MGDHIKIDTRISSFVSLRNSTTIEVYRYKGNDEIAIRIKDHYSQWPAVAHLLPSQVDELISIIAMIRNSRA